MKTKLMIISGVGVIALAVGCDGNHPVAGPAASPRAAPASQSPVPAASAPVITAAQERFIDAVRGRYAAVAKGSTSSMLATFETDVCQYIQGGSNVATAEQAAQSAWLYTWATSAPSTAKITKLVLLAATDGCNTQLTAVERLAAKQARKARAARREARQDAAAAAAARRLAHTVTYVVTGSTANVIYGPAGSDYQGYVPMDISARLGSPAYYAITAQLQGGGSVSCEILVGGRVISRASASGGYNIATCEISQDPIYGGWVNTNGG